METRTRKIPSQVIVAVLPFYGYIAAYSYDEGYLSSFALPSQLVQVRIESLVTFTGSFILFFFIVVGLMNFVDDFYKEPNKHLLVRDVIELTYIPLILILSAFYFDILLFWKSFPFAAALLAISLLAYFIIPIFKFKDKKLSYSEKLALDRAERKRKSRPSKNSFFFSSEPVRYVFIFILLAFTTIFVANLLGSRDAEKKNKFIIFSKNNQEYGLIRKYGNELIGIKINNGKFTNEYLLLKEMDTVEFTNRDVSR